MKISDETKALNETLTEWLRVRGLTFSCSGGQREVDVRQDYEGKESRWEHFRWRVVLADRVRPLLTTDYKKGVGHVTDGRNPYKDLASGKTFYRVPPRPIPAMVCEVMASWLSDADCVRCETFGGFCDSFGYSRDSIHALEVYRECQNIQEVMNNTFDSVQREELREMLRDY